MDNMSEKWKDIVRTGLDSFGISAGTLQIEQLAFHADEMLKWNKKTNLTSITDPVEVAVKHVIDSSILANYCSGSVKILDIGTGGGFPGIPLKILDPELDVTLIETVRKKVSFLKHVIRSLKLENIKAIQARGEEQSESDEFGGKFDVVICRAFSGLDKFVNMAIPYLKEDGLIFAMKGRETEQEIELLKKVDANLFNGRNIRFNDLQIELKEYKLPVIISDRVLFIIKLNALVKSI